MAEALEDFDMKDLDEKYSEYDSMSNDNLTEIYERYGMEDYDSMSNESKERFNYIKKLVKSIVPINKETSFDGTLTNAPGEFPHIPGETIEGPFDINKFMGFTPTSTDGPNSSKLVEGMEEVKKDGKADGWKFKGKKIVVSWGRGITN